MNPELTKSFIFLEDELGYLLQGLRGPCCAPIEALSALPYDPVAVERRLLEKRILQAAPGGPLLAGVVRFLLTAAAGAERYVVLCTPEAVLLRSRQLVMLLAPYPRNPKARQLTPYPDLSAACDALPAPIGELQLFQNGALDTCPAPTESLYDWLVKQGWT